MWVLEMEPTCNPLGREGHCPQEALINVTGMSLLVAVSLSVCSDPATQMRLEIKSPPCWTADEELL